MTHRVSLNVALNDGFYNDHVVIAVDGREVKRLDAATTKVQVGRAATIPLQLEAGRVSLTIDVRGKPSTGPVALDLRQPTYVNVSVVNDTVRIELSDSPSRHA